MLFLPHKPCKPLEFVYSILHKIFPNSKRFAPLPKGLTHYSILYRLFPNCKDLNPYLCNGSYFYA